MYCKNSHIFNTHLPTEFIRQDNDDDDVLQKFSYLYLFATKINYILETAKDLSQKVSFSYQINGRSSSGSTSQLRKNISFSAFSFGKVK